MCTNSTFSPFLDTPKFLSTSLNIITFIGIPIHLIGALCILSKTPPQMTPMKWVMLSLHLWSVSLDVSIGYLIVPFMYQPVLAGYGLGLLNELGVKVADMYYLCVVQIAGVIVSVAVLFETRFYVLYARETFWRRLRRPWLVLNFLVAFTYMIPTYLSIPEDQKEAKKVRFGKLPCLPQEVYEDRVLLLSSWSPFVGYNMSVNTAGIQAVLFVILIYWNLRKSSRTMKLSMRTLEMQKKFLSCLILQVLIPTITLIIPIFYSTFSGVTHYYNQGANNITVCIMATHGIVSSLAMILLHKSYWEAVGKVFCPKWLIVEKEVMATIT